MQQPNSRTKQPNSRMCFVCGLENTAGLHGKFYQTRPGCVDMEWTAPERYQGYPGILHGGIAAALLDEAAGRTTMLEDPPRFMVTMKMETRYRKPIPIGKPLKITGEIVRDRGRRAEAIAKIMLPDGNVGAEANVWLALPSEKFMQVDDLERIGWKVYPDMVDDKENYNSSEPERRIP